MPLTSDMSLDHGSLPAFLPPQGAHHLDLRAANRLDPHSVIVARDFHQQNIAGWIKEFHMQQQAKNEL